MNEGLATASRFDSIIARGKLVVALFAGGMLLNAIATVSDVAQLLMLNRIAADALVSEAEIEANFARQDQIGLLQVGVYLLMGVLFLVWFHGAHKNLPSLNAHGLRYSPRWAVGGFFAPIMNAWRPWQVMVEVWKASDPTVDVSDDAAWQQAGKKRLVHIWWVAFLVSSFLDQLPQAMLSRADSMSEYINITWAYIASDGFAVLAAIPAILVVREVTARQERKHDLVRYSPTQFSPWQVAGDSGPA